MNEIKGTNETFFNEENDKNNSECSLDLKKSEISFSLDKLIIINIINLIYRISNIYILLLYIKSFI